MNGLVSVIFVDHVNFFFFFSKLKCYLAHNAHKMSASKCCSLQGIRTNFWKLIKNLISCPFFDCHGPSCGWCSFLTTCDAWVRRGNIMVTRPGSSDNLQFAKERVFRKFTDLYSFSGINDCHSASLDKVKIFDWLVCFNDFWAMLKDLTVHVHEHFADEVFCEE